MEVISQTESIYTIIVAIITVLGSAGAWRYYERKAESKREEDNFMKYDCRERIAKLEALLERSSDEKNDMRDKILVLTEEIAELRVKVNFLEAENRRLLEKR
jgi:hypothetical protein